MIGVETRTNRYLIKSFQELNFSLGHIFWSPWFLKDPWTKAAFLAASRLSKYWHSALILEQRPLIRLKTLPNNKMAIVFWTRLDQICPKWVKMDQTWSNWNSHLEQRLRFWQHHVWSNIVLQPWSWNKGRW